jgi:hypothetical protein
MSLLAELKRRKVVRVAVVYAATTRSHVTRFRELEPDAAFQFNCTLAFFLRTPELGAARQLIEDRREYFEQREPLTAALPRAWGSALEYGLGQIELLRGNHAPALAHLGEARQP